MAALSLPPPRSGDAAISVVVPLFNHARYIADALDSVAAQTAPPCDLVVVDDGSTDGGGDLAARLLAGAPRATLLRQDNQGAPAAIARAVAACRGDYIAVLNSDDRFLPDKLARCQQLLAADPPLDLIAGRIEPIDARGRVLTRGVTIDWLARARAFAATSGSVRLALLHENDVATTSNMVISRRLWQRLGGFAALRYCHDLEFLLRAFDHGRVRLDREHAHVQYRVHDRNTIAENIHHVRLELAAVIAAALHESGARLLPDGGDGLEAFAAFLRAKDLSDAVLYLAALRQRCDSRAAFFAQATQEPLRGRLLRLLRGAR